MELLNDNYIKKFGEDKVIKSDILDIDKNNKNASIVDDIRDLRKIKDNTYDCIILTQVLQFIDDVPAAISECHRILKKDGVILATVPSLGRVDCSSGEDYDFWRFTTASVNLLFSKIFDKSKILVSSAGNVRTGIYFLAGLSIQDVPKKILEENDRNFPNIITIKAKK